MSDYVIAVLKLKAPYDADPEQALALLSQDALDTFGEGGKPDAKQVEDFLGYVNTPPLQGYVRTRIGLAYGQALEYIETQGGNKYAELIRIEWSGLGFGINTEGELDGSWPEITVTVDTYDEEDNINGTHQQFIGKIA
jgi:hypothetical protein